MRRRPDVGQIPFEPGLLLLAGLLLLRPDARWPGWMEVGWLLLAVAAAAFLVADGTDRPSAVVGQTLPGGFLLGNAALLGGGLLAIGIGGGRVWHGAMALAGGLWLWPILQQAWPMVVPAALLLGALMLGLAGLVRVVRPGGVFRALQRRQERGPDAPGPGIVPGVVLVGLPLLLLMLPLPVSIRLLGAGALVVLALVLVPGRLHPGPILHGVAVLAFLAAALALPQDYWLVPGAGIAAWLLSGLWPWHRLGEFHLAPVSLLLLLAMGNAAIPLGVRYWDVAALGLLLPGLAHAVAVRDGGRIFGALALATAWFATPGGWSTGALAAGILMTGALLLSWGTAVVHRWPVLVRRVALVPVGWGVLQFLQSGLSSQVVLTLTVAMVLAGACLTRARGAGRVASVP